MPTLRPEYFTPAEWQELYAVTEMVPLEKRKANLSQKELREAIRILANKIVSIVDGELGEEFYPRMDQFWILELSTIIGKLTVMLRPTEKRKRRSKPEDSRVWNWSIKAVTVEEEKKRK